MSGVFGFWNLDGRPADRGPLEAMAAALAHRGPDGWNGWCEGELALGHRMLRATPESLHETQPLISADGSRVVVADLRLDNREALLGEHGRHRQTGVVTDVELVERAYAAHGSGSVDRLLGDFAVVAWDARRRELVLMRDHFGVRPLYYCHIPGRLFAFASEIKALFALDGVPDAVNELEVARHLLIPVEEDPAATYYRQVRRMLPAHVLTVSASGLRERQYWALDGERTVELGSDGEYAEAVRDVFMEAVRCRLRSAGPIASMLSGGIDSSAVTCAAARLLANMGDAPALRTLSAVYPDVPASDEREYIDSVREAHRLESTFFDADRVSPIAEAQRLNWLGDGANKAGNLYLNAELYRAASSGGARVVLDGFDGDSTISHGQGWLVELALAGRWWRLARETRSLARSLDEPWAPVFRSWIRLYGLEPLRRRLPRRGRRRSQPADGPPTPRWTRHLTPEFAAAVAAHITPPVPQARTEREHHMRLITRPLLLHMLGWAEAMGSGAGVEVRFPFFDVRLVELCVALPAEQKLRGGWSRFVMRNAMAGILPESIRWRRDKSDLEPGFHHALRTHGSTGLGAAVAAEGRLARFIDRGAALDLHDRFMTGSLSPAEHLQYWRIASLALWLDGSGKARSARSAVMPGEIPTGAAVTYAAGTPHFKEVPA